MRSTNIKTRYQVAHYHARKHIGDSCSHCGVGERLEAALRPDAPRDRLVDGGKLGFFSECPGDYFALCVPCHRKLDHVTLRTHCRSGHEYTPSNTYVRANGTRRCRTCHRANEAQRLQTPELRAAKNAADRAYRHTRPMTADQKKHKIELQRLRRAVVKAGASQ